VSDVFQAIIEPNDRSRRLLAVVLLMALAVRLGWGITRPNDAAAIGKLPDQREYLELGENLRHGNGLVMHDPRFAGPVYAYRTPGYPFLIALCGAKPVVVRCAQALLDTSTVLAIYLLARRWMSAGWGVAAATGVAINPYQIYFSGLILSETLFTAMLCWAMVLMARRRYSFGALLLALSIVVRPSALLMPPIVVGVASLLNSEIPKPYVGLRTLYVAMVACVLTVIALLPWAARNKQLLGRWIWTTTNGGITLYDGLNPNATGASDQRFVHRVPEVSSAGEVERDRLFHRQAMDWAMRNPIRVMQLAIVKVLRMWSPLPLSADFGRPLYQWIGGLWAVPFDLLVILGLCCGRLPWPVKVFLLLPAIYLTAIHAVSVGSLRYRLPAEAPMAVLAAAGIQSIVKKRNPTSA
jgi:4-amino-4-deoxy-L-arabinose transferase-like glycosyltransferase